MRNGREGYNLGIETVEKLCFSNSLSIETTLSIEYSAVCARPMGTLDSGLYKNRDTWPRPLSLGLRPIHLVLPVFMNIALRCNILFDARLRRGCLTGKGEAPRKSAA